MSYPILLKIGPLSISTLGVCLFIGFVLAAFSLYRRAKEEHLPEEICFDLLFLNLLFALLGARLLYIIHFWSDFSSRIISFVQFFQKPGLIYWGAVIAIILTTFIYSRRHSFDYFKMLDNFVFSVIIFKFFAVLGMLFDGSYSGISRTLSLGGKEYQLIYQPALYELVFLPVFLIIMHKISREYRTYSWYQGKKGESKPGFVVLSFLLSYSVFRIILANTKTYSLYLKQIDVFWSIIFIIISAILIYIRSGLFDKKTFARIWSKTSIQNIKYDKKTNIRKPYRSPIKAGKDARQ